MLQWTGCWLDWQLEWPNGNNIGRREWPLPNHNLRKGLFMRCYSSGYRHQFSNHKRMENGHNEITWHESLQLRNQSTATDYMGWICWLFNKKYDPTSHGRCDLVSNRSLAHKSLCEFDTRLLGTLHSSLFPRYVRLGNGQKTNVSINLKYFNSTYELETHLPPETLIERENILSIRHILFQCIFSSRHLNAMGNLYGLKVPKKVSGNGVQ